MDNRDILAEQFETHRTHLRAVAYRMLGSASEADDAVQESWLRLSRAGADDVENLGGWLTTVVARVCLDMLRSRTSRRETTIPETLDMSGDEYESDPEQEALLADSVGPALLVVLDTLTPAERLAFVLHDVFAVPFDEIAPIIDRSPTATRKLASRARKRVQGGFVTHDADITQQRRVVDAFLAASREGDFTALLEVLDPDVVLRSDHVAVPDAPYRFIQGAANVARRALSYSGGARLSQLALVDGSVGIVLAPHGPVQVVLLPTIERGRIVEFEIFGDPNTIERLDIVMLEE